MQNFPRFLQSYLTFDAFFSKILVKSRKNFEKSQENFNKRSGKISHLDLWQPCISGLRLIFPIKTNVYYKFLNAEVLLRSN